MAFFPDDMPAPAPNFDDAMFWAHCKRRELRFQCCAQCGHARHPPSPVCPRCRSLTQNWQQTDGAGTVFSFTTIHHASHEAVKVKLPYVVAVVEFDDVPGVRLVTNITEVDPKHLAIGMRVTVWWDTLADGQVVPRCRPTDG